MKSGFNNGSMKRKITSALCALLLLVGSIPMQTLAAVPVGVTGITPIGTPWAGAWGFTINLDENIALTQIINMQANTDLVLQNAVRDNIIIDGKTVRTILTEKGNDYAVMIAYSGTTMIFSSDQSWGLLNPNTSHTVKILSGLTDETKTKTFNPVTYYFNPTTQLWSTPPPSINVTSIGNIITAWANTWGVTFTLDRSVVAGDIGNLQMSTDPILKAAVRNNIKIDGVLLDTILTQKGDYTVMVGYINNTFSLYSEKAQMVLDNTVGHKVEILSGLVDSTKTFNFTNASYFYNPSNGTWSTTRSSINGISSISPIFTQAGANWYFELTPNLNVASTVSDLTALQNDTNTNTDLKTSVRNNIVIDGKSIGELITLNSGNQSIVDVSFSNTKIKFSSLVASNLLSPMVDHTITVAGLISANGVSEFASETYYYSAYTQLWTSSFNPVTFIKYTKSADKKITDVMPGAKVSDFANAAGNIFTESGSVLEIRNPVGTLLTNANDPVGTGSTVRVLKNAVLIDTFTVVTYGDIDGNSAINIADLAKLKDGILKIQDITGVESIAADVNKEGSITITDLLHLKKYILNIMHITQSVDKINVWSAPSGTASNSTFNVGVKKTTEVNWTNLFTYNVKTGLQATPQAYNSSMVNFDFQGTIDVSVTYNGTINTYDIRPSGYAISATKNGNTLTFRLKQNPDAPLKLVVRINDSWDTECLHIVTNSPETDVPSEIASNVYVINPGDSIPRVLPTGKDTYFFKAGNHDLPKGMWVEIDLGATYDVNKFEVVQLPESPTYFFNTGAQKYLVETKVNAGDAYTTAYDGTGNTTAFTTLSNTIATKQARYVRLVLLGNVPVAGTTASSRPQNYIFSNVIADFRVFQQGDAITNIAFNKAIAGAVPGYEKAVDGLAGVNNSYIVTNGQNYANWHSGEVFFISKDNYKVYLAPGSMLNGSFSSEGINGVKVYGRGIINCSNFGDHNNAGMNNEGRTGALQLTSGKNITVDGITVLDPPMWAIVANYSDSVIIKNVNVFASVVNGDAVHFSAASNITISGIFARACDDQLVAYHYGNTNIITIKNSVIWSDEGSCILMGLGSTGDTTNVIVKDIAVLNHKGVSADLDKYNGVMKIWPNGTTCSVSNVAFKNVRIDTVKTPASSAIFQVRTDKNFSGDANGKTAENISFENISYAGAAGTLQNSLLQGVSSSSKVNGVAFKNVVVGGTTVLSSGNTGTYITQTGPSFITNVTYSN